MKSRKKKKEFYTEYTARNALKNGSFIVRLSAIVFGLGCLVHKQIAKGILYLTSEILLIVYMVQTGFYNLSKFRTLGDVEQQKVWNEAKSLYEYVDGDRSLIILLYGIVTLSLILVFFLPDLIGPIPALICGGIVIGFAIYVYNLWKTPSPLDNMSSDNDAEENK